MGLLQEFPLNETFY